MDWIKRNLFFVIGSVVALALLGLAGWFLYSKWTLDNENLAKLNQDYADLGNLNSQKPHPGAGQVDNIKAAKEQQQQLRKFIQDSRKYFERIPPIPDVPKLKDQDLSAALSRTVVQLQLDATNSSVSLPANYKFSFEAQFRKLSFATGSLEPVATQLGEVKAICEVLFQAKVNSLDSLKRERVSADDSSQEAVFTDYLPDKSVTNELAVLTPYELTFRCFSSELAAVLAGFASSPHALFVKTINVEQAPAEAQEPTAPGSVAVTPQYGMPQVMQRPEQDAAAAFASRYGLTPGRGNPYGRGADRYGAGPSAGGIAYRPLMPGPGAAYAPQPVQPVQPAQTAQPGTPVAGKGGLPTVLDEKQLKITINLNVLKLLPAKEPGKEPAKEPVKEPAK